MNSEFNILINTRLDTSGDSLKDMSAQVALIQSYLEGDDGVVIKTKLSDNIQEELSGQMSKMRQTLEEESLLIKAQLDTNSLHDMEEVFSSFRDGGLDTNLSLRMSLSPDDEVRIKEEMTRVQDMIREFEIKPVEINLGLREGVLEGLKNNIQSLENELKDMDISIGIGIDEDSEKKLQEQLKDMQVQIDNIKKSDAFGDIREGAKSAQESSQQMSKNIEDARRSADLLSEKLRTTDTGELISSEQLRRTGLTETEKTITSYSGKDKTTVLETENDYIRAQKDLYEAIKKLRRDIIQIDNQAVKATGEEVSALMEARKERENLISQARANLDTHGLINSEMEEELRLAAELNQIQLEIRQNKDMDVQSRRAYKELEREISEQHRLQKRAITETNEVQQATMNQIEYSKERQQKIQERIDSEGLENAQRKLEISELLLRSEEDLNHTRAKSMQKEDIRIAKLNEKVVDMDFAEHNIVDDDAMKRYVMSLHEANAEITKFTPHIDAAGNRQIKMSVATDTASNKLKEYKYVIDESSGALYKLGEATKPNTARMMGFLGQMREAITKSITWGISMELLYGNIRRLREGVEFIKELDRELTQVKIITGMTNEETKELARSYAVLGQEMGKTVTEISNVNTELIRQGLSAEESAKRMQTVMKLSATSGMGTEQALQIATSSVNALGIEAEHTSDVLLKAGQISASSADEIGEALTKMASSAKASGMSVEETTALISTLVEVTQESPSSLGNSLKTLMARFSQVNEETGETNEELNKVQEAFESVGVAFTDSEGQIKPFYELLVGLNEVWGDLDKNTRSYIATSAAGKQNLMPAHTVMCA